MASIVVMVVLLTVVGLAWHSYQRAGERTDRRICQAMQALDGLRFAPAVESAIRAAGKGAHTHLGAIARAADARTWPGHLSLVSQDYDYVTSRCFELNLPVPHVD